MADIVIPNHIGFIVDGNRRWAKERNLPSYMGHAAGSDAVWEVMSAVFESGVKFATAYIFSTENWKRSGEEVGKIMELMLKMLTSNSPYFEKNNIKLLILGSRDNISDKILKAIDNAEMVTSKNTAGTLALCFNYGGQQEIVDAAKNIIRSGVDIDNIDVALISKNLYSPEIPPIDIIVRTSGEQRISNFMLWRAAYSEMMFIDKYWPDMTKDDVGNIIKEYSKRSRRFGG